jgi:hypothetical protein
MDATTTNLIIGGAIGVLGTLLGTIISGFFNRSNLRLQLQSAQNFERAKQRKKDLEELHQSISILYNSVEDFVGYLESIDFDLSWSQRFEKFVIARKNVSDNFPIIHAKIRLHAKEHLSQYGSVQGLAREILREGRHYFSQAGENLGKVNDYQNKFSSELTTLVKGIEGKIH